MDELKSVLQSVIQEALVPIQQELQTLNQRVGSIETELKAFRHETEANFQVLIVGNEGLREQLAQRAKETKEQIEEINKSLVHITAVQDFQRNKLSQAEQDLYILKTKNQ